MKIKRYFAPDMRQAIRKVREEQGPDAVILSNRRVNGGVEIISALDYDESLFGEVAQRNPAPAPSAPGAPATAPEHRPAGEPPAEETRRVSVEWSQDPTLVEMRREIKTLRGMLENQLSHLTWSDLARRHPLKARLLERLSEMGISPEVGREIVARAADTGEPDQAWRQALAVLAHRIPVTDDDILSHGGVVALVGPTGVGKTTMVAKLAARFALRHGKRHVALVSTDNFRIGAYEQLHTYGQLIGVPVYSATDPQELARILGELCDKRLVLIDTAGMSQRDMRLSEQLATLHGGDPAVRTYLVLSANTQLATQNEVVQAFRRTRLDGCILTKLDEAVSLGAALSAVVRHGLPVAYVGDGQRVPEDMHPARAHSLVSRAVALIQQRGQQEGTEDEPHTNGSNHGNTADAHV